MNYASVYSCDESRQGEDRYFGLFPGQRVMGYHCAVKVDKMPDADPRAIDILGVPGAFSVGGWAIHISGLNSYGELAFPAEIRAIGMYKLVFETSDGKKPVEKNTSFGGTGVDHAEPCVLLADDDHHAHFSACDHFVTLAGIHARFKDELMSFGPEHVCRYLDEHRAKPYTARFANSKQHTTAVRRLLECAVDTAEVVEGMCIHRYGRWSYKWWKV